MAAGRRNAVKLTWFDRALTDLPADQPCWEVIRYEREVALLKHAKRIRTRVKWDSITYMTEVLGTSKTIQGWRVWINAVQFPRPQLEDGAWDWSWRYQGDADSAMDHAMTEARLPWAQLRGTDSELEPWDYEHR